MMARLTPGELPNTGGEGSGIAALVEDTAPQLGGNLDLNGFTVGSATAGDLTKLNSVTATSTELNYVDGVTSAIQTQLDGKVNDTGNETIAGVKTFSSDPLIPDEVYGAGWNGSLEPATKNAVYDKIETLGGGLTEANAIAYAVAL